MIACSCATSSPVDPSEDIGRVVGHYGVAHELRHTIEVIDEPTVNANEETFFLYQRIGQYGTATGAMETKGAGRGQRSAVELRAFSGPTICRIAGTSCLQTGRRLAKSEWCVSARLIAGQQGGDI